MGQRIFGINLLMPAVLFAFRNGFHSLTFQLSLDLQDEYSSSKKKGQGLRARLQRQEEPGRES